MKTAFVIQLAVMAFLWALAIWGAWHTGKEYRGIEAQKKRAPQ
jgi:multisubunit Na+/H+ antiporter MnhC subunit